MRTLTSDKAASTDAALPCRHRPTLEPLKQINDPNEIVAKSGPTGRRLNKVGQPVSLAVG